MEYDKFTDNFSRYFSMFENTKGKNHLVKLALKEIKENELPSRDETKLFKIRNFTNSENLNINLIYKNLWCKQDTENELIVGTITPDWQRNWKRISKDEFISEQIDLFFHLVTQYVYRSYQINLITAISFTYNRLCDFRGDRIWQYYLPLYNGEYEKFNHSINIDCNSRIERLKHYLEVINSLEPYINKANFYYLKAIDLMNNGFLEEAITNLDNTIDTISQYIKGILKIPTRPRKEIIEIVSKELQLNSKIQADLEKLYLLRCRFSSHPAQSKWWDFGEIYDDDIDNLKECVQYILIKMLQYETKNRKVSANPSKWSNWFFANANVLFEAIWFHKIPR